MRRFAEARRGASSGRWAVLAVALLLASTLLVVHIVRPARFPGPPRGVITIVAAENFWGSLVAQLGGVHVSVLSVVSDPNADPHEYETNATDAIAVSDAQLVIENGAGYDDWCAHLLSATPTPGPLVLNVAGLLGKPLGSNPHFWYGQSYVVAAIAAMYSDLVQIDPGNTSYFQQRYAALNASLAPAWSEEAYISTHWGGGRVQVASTELIFQYMANSAGLDLVSPYAFMSAVSEGNDPPTQSVTTFQDQLASGLVRLLVYNNQTVTPLTSQMQTLAIQDHVPVVAVSETIQPPTLSFQAWMLNELLAISHALTVSVGP